MEDAPVVPEVVAEAVVEAVAEPIVEPVVEPVAVAVVAPPQEVAAVPSPRTDLDIKLLLLGPSRKNIKEVNDETFSLKDAKQALVMDSLQAAFPGEDIQVTDGGKTILIGADHSLSFLVRDDSPLILIHCFGDEADHSRVYKLNVTLFQLLL
jgi:hypothetical protein